MSESTKAAVALLSSRERWTTRMYDDPAEHGH
jgi:hypothetical protein